MKFVFKSWLLFFVLVSVANAEEIQVIFKSPILTKKNEVSLDKVIDVKNLDPQVVESIFKEKIILSSQKQSQYFVSSSDLIPSVLKVLKQKNTEHSPGIKWQINISGEKKLLVVTTKKDFTAEILKAEYLQKLTEICNLCEFEFLSFNLPKTNNELILDWTMDEPQSAYNKSFQIGLNISLLNKNAEVTRRKYWIIGQMQILQKVLVLKNSVLPQDKIYADNIEEQMREVSTSFDLPASLQDIQQSRAKKRLMAGEIVLRSSLEREKAVKRGQILRAISRASEIEIEMQAIAQADAFVGEIVNVLNPNSKQVISAQVLEPGLVEIK